MVQPQPLGIGGERLVEPQICPVGQCDGIAEPLVGELVRQQELLQHAGLPAWEVVAGEERPSLRLHRQTREALGECQPISIERIRTEQGLEERQLVVGQVEVRLHLIDVVGQRDVDDRDGAGDTVVEDRVVAGQHLDEVRRHRLALFPHPRVAFGAGPLLEQLTVGDRGDAARDHQLESPGRLVGRVVVARQPGVRAVGLVQDE